MKTVYLVQVNFGTATAYDYGLFTTKEEAEKQVKIIIKRIKENGRISDGVSITPMGIYESVEDYWR